MINFVFFACLLVLGVAEKNAYSPYIQPQQQQHFFGGGYSQHPPQPQQHNYNYGGGQQQQYYGGGGGYKEEKKDDGFSALTFQFEDLEIECFDETENEVPCGGKKLLSTTMDEFSSVRLKSRKNAVVTDQCVNKDIGRVSFTCTVCGPGQGILIFECTYKFATDYGDFVIEGKETLSPAFDCDVGDSPFITINCPLCKATPDKKYSDEIKKVTLLSFSGISVNTVLSYLAPFDAEFFVNVNIEKEESHTNTPYSIAHQQPNHYGYQQPAQTYQRPAHVYQQPASYKPQPAPYGPQPAQTYQRPAHVYQQPGATYGQQNSYKQPSTYQTQGGYQQQPQANTYQKPSSQDYQQKPAYGTQQQQTYQQMPQAYSQQQMIQPLYGGGNNYNPQPVGYGGQPVYNPYQRH